MHHLSHKAHATYMGNPTQFCPATSTPTFYLITSASSRCVIVLYRSISDNLHYSTDCCSRNTDVHASNPSQVMLSLLLLLLLHLSTYSCRSHLKHRTSVKFFVSVQFHNLRQAVGLLGRRISPSQGRYLHTEQT
jgi:hypothetical protein